MSRPVVKTTRTKFTKRTEQQEENQKKRIHIYEDDVMDTIDLKRIRESSDILTQEDFDAGC